jgi:hypothetical protein
VFYGDSPLGEGAETVIVGDFAPQLACFWLKKNTEEGAAQSHTVQGVFLESGAPDVVAQLPGVARAQPRVSAEALRAARTVDEALQLVGVKV